MIKQAFILAAGLGSRMRPITDLIPKPMIKINGQSIITRAIDQLIAYGIEKIIINAFYKADLLKAHIAAYIKEKQIKADIRIILEEPEILDTGGGIINILPYLDDAPVFIVNGDAIWTGGENPFTYLNKRWRDDMRALFLLIETEKAVGYDERGDFALSSDNMLIKPESNETLPYAYIGLRVTKPQTFAAYYNTHKLKKVRVMDIYKQFKNSKNVYQNFYGTVFNGQWFHVGTPEAIGITENKLKDA